MVIFLLAGNHIKVQLSGGAKSQFIGAADNNFKLRFCLAAAAYGIDRNNILAASALMPVYCYFQVFLWPPATVMLPLPAVHRKA